MKATILGVHIDRLTFDEALQHIITLAKQEGRSYVVTANPEIVVAAQKNQHFKDIINQAHLVVADGVGLQTEAEFLYGQQLPHNFIVLLLRQLRTLFATFVSRTRFTILPQRITGVDLVQALCQWAAGNQFPVFFIGGAEGEAAAAAKVIATRHPSLDITTIQGPNDITTETEEDLNSVYQALRTKQRALCFVAFGHPKQELWIAKHLSNFPYGVAMGVGGTFTFLSGRKKRAYPIIQKFGLEWFWRLLNEPTRLKRIYTAVVYFPYLVLKSVNSQ